MTYKCPECVRNKLSAAMWRNEAYKHAGIELPWSPEEMIEEAVKEEREECAKVAEERFLDKANCTAEEMYELQKKSIAAAIRERGQK